MSADFCDEVLTPLYCFNWCPPSLKMKEVSISFDSATQLPPYCWKQSAGRHGGVFIVLTLDLACYPPLMVIYVPEGGAQEDPYHTVHLSGRPHALM